VLRQDTRFGSEMESIETQEKCLLNRSRAIMVRSIISFVIEEALLFLPDVDRQIQLLKSDVPCGTSHGASCPNIHARRYGSSSQRISETNQTFDRLATSLRTGICPPELELHRQSDDDDQRRGNHAGPDSWAILRLVLLTEDGATNDAANTAEADEGGRAQCALPLAANVVGLPGEHTGDIGIAGRRGEEDTKVTDTHVLDVSKETEAYENSVSNGKGGGNHDGLTEQAETAVKDDEGRSNVPFVTKIGEGEHDNGCKNVWRCNETLRSGDVEAHADI
jgi:hypothetical protein